MVKEINDHIGKKSIENVKIIKNALKKALELKWNENYL